MCLRLRWICTGLCHCCVLRLRGGGRAPDGGEMAAGWRDSFWPTLLLEPVRKKAALPSAV
jgi:hypothetical protein